MSECYFGYNELENPAKVTKKSEPTKYSDTQETESNEAKSNLRERESE